VREVVTILDFSLAAGRCAEPVPVVVEVTVEPVVADEAAAPGVVTEVEPPVVAERVAADPLLPWVAVEAELVAAGDPAGVKVPVRFQKAEKPLNGPPTT
jgi:hypothetical protein